MASKTDLLISRIYDAAERTGIIDTFGRSWPMQGSVLRIRPYVLALSLTWLLILGVLGLAPLPDLWIDDKVLHFFGMGISTFLNYYILQVPDSARRIWYYRRAPLLLVLGVNFLMGDVGSEMLQGWLPYRTFDPLDIISNLLGSTLFFTLAHALSRHARRRWEIGRLYRPEREVGGRGYGYAQVGDDEIEDEVTTSRSGSKGNGAGHGSERAGGVGLGRGMMRPRENSMSSLISLDGDPEGDVWNERRGGGSGRQHYQGTRRPEGQQGHNDGGREGLSDSKMTAGEASDGGMEGSKAAPTPGLELAGPAVFHLGDDDDDYEGDESDVATREDQRGPVAGASAAEYGIKGLI